MVWASLDEAAGLRVGASTPKPSRILLVHSSRGLEFRV